MIFYEEILKAFQKRKVKYVIVGGYAVNLLGSMRTTVDLDILVEMSDNNLKKIVSILISYGYRVRQPIDPEGIADKRVREEWIERKRMKALNFYKEDELKEVDIIIDSPVSFGEAQRGAVRIKIGNLTVPVISIDKLIIMKKKTGRAVDRFDVHELKKIKAIRKKYGL